MKHYNFLLLLAITFLLSACSPHPAAGVWESEDGNDYGISRLVVTFDGKAEFETRKLDNATWHCFWATTGKQEVSLDCTSSINPDKTERYIFSTDNLSGTAELKYKLKSIARFRRLNENPVLN